MTEKNVLIIGGGPAGLAAGITWSRRKNKTVLLERCRNAGRKLLLSGSGQCNITRSGSIGNFLTHYGGKEKGRFVKPSLYRFDNQAVIQFFENHNVPVMIRSDGKVFPQSLRAGDIRNALFNQFQHSGGQLLPETCVHSVRKENGQFEVQTGQGCFGAEILVIATGGKSYPQTGSDGSGFRLAEMLGHSIVVPKPALAALKVRHYAFSESAGTAFENIPVELRRNGKKVCRNQGSVLLTHTGLSGPAVLDMSRFIEPEDILTLQLVESQEVFASLYQGKKTLKNTLQPLGLPERFLEQLLDFLSIPPEQRAAETPRETRKKLESALTALPFEAEKTGGWDEAAATAGGVALAEVDRKTLESKIVPNLYFCGEVLDIDGDTGGYNIQFALSSGFCTGGTVIH